MDNSWVKLYRKLGDNVFLMHDEKAFNVFVKLLIFVNRNGEYAAGRRQLGELLDINPRTLYDVLIRLENQQMIQINANKRYSVIRICNWENYQTKPNNKLALGPTMSQPLANHSPTTRQHYNKNKKEKKNIKENLKIFPDKEKSPRISNPISLGETFRAMKNKKDKKP